MAKSLILPKPYVRRRALITGAAALAAMAALPTPARAAATTWDPSNGSYLNFLENGNLRVRLAQLFVTYAFNIGTKTFWAHSSYSDLWNDGAIGSENPVGNVGGYPPASLGAAPYFAAAYQQASTKNWQRLNFGASTIRKLPTGYSTYNALAGATVTLDPSFNTSGNIAYSNGNLDCRQTNTVGYANALCSKATHGLSSGLACWEHVIFSEAAQQTGWIRSNQANTNYLHELANSGGSAGAGQYAYNNAGGGHGGVGSPRCAPRTTVATNGISCGKSYVQFSSTVNTQHVGYGYGPGTHPITSAPNGVGTISRVRSSSLNTLHINNVASAFTPDAVAAGDAEGLYLDWTAAEGWLYCQTTNRYNASGTASPTNPGSGFSIAALVGSPLFAITGCGDDTIKADNGYVDADFATCPSIPHPSGYAPYDSVSCGGGDIYYIFGANSPARRAFRTLLAV